MNWTLPLIVRPNMLNVMIFRLTLKSIGEKQTAFQKTLTSQGYTYKYILKLHKAQEKMLDKMYTPKVVECVNEILKVYNNLQRF